MKISLGNSDLSSCKAGGVNVSKIYNGSTLAWSEYVVHIVVEMAFDGILPAFDSDVYEIVKREGTFIYDCKTKGAGTNISFDNVSNNKRVVSVYVLFAPNLVSLRNMCLTTSPFMESLEWVEFSPDVDMSKVEDMYWAFPYGTVLKSVVFNGLTSPTVNAEAMFRDSSSLECFDMIDTSSAASTTDMFYGCSSLLRPNTSEQSDIIAGTSWTNDSPCP